jgi:mannose-1-phosphate guanylyltransferase/phosphomannomutase
MLSQQYQSSHTTQIDGIRIDLNSDEWVLVLPDAERPLFHIFAESSSNEGAHTLVEKYSALVASLQR